MLTTAITAPNISGGQYHHFIFIRRGYSIDVSRILICLSSSLLALTEAFLPVEMRDNSEYADDDKINPYEIVKYLRENHDDDAENKRNYAPQ